MRPVKIGQQLFLRKNKSVEFGGIAVAEWNFFGMT